MTHVPLPKSLALYTANNENVTQSVITDLTGSSVQSGNLIVDEMSYEETYYSFDITSFLQTNLGTTGYDRQKLQLFLPDNLFYTTLQALSSATENIPPIKRIPNLSYFTKLINNEKDFVLPSGILYSCLYSYCAKYNELPYFHVRTGRAFYRGRRAICRTGRCRHRIARK